MKLQLKQKHFYMYTIASFFFAISIIHAIITGHFTTITTFMVIAYMLLFGSVFLFAFALAIIDLIKMMIKNWNKPFKF